MDHIAEMILDSLRRGEEERCTHRIRYRSRRDSRRYPAPTRKRGWLWTWARFSLTERQVIAYSSLGIGRLIYQLPIPLCKMFIREIFDGKSPDDFDEETLDDDQQIFREQPERVRDIADSFISTGIRWYTVWINFRRVDRA